MSVSPFSYKKFRFVFTCCWLVIIAQHALLLYFYEIPWKMAIADSLVSNALLLLCTLLIMNTIRYYLPGVKQFFNFFLLCFVITILEVLLARWILGLLPAGDADYSAFLQRSFAIRLSIALLFLGCVSLICIIWRRQQDQKEFESRKADAEKLARDAELYRLRQQLQPHFLFNSLNSINALIGSQPKEARRMVQQLSEFLRGTIKKDETQWVTLGEELQHLQLYLDIESIRFGNRLQTVIDTDEGTAAMKIPALLLQPVVENAIKFGLYDTFGEITIRIHASVDSNHLLITVTNPFDVETSANRTGVGFGLKSIERRLYLLFARNNLLTTHTEGNIFSSVIKIPQPDL
ncbi:MAG: histidine kinase [Ferruginibacter sp.]